MFTNTQHRDKHNTHRQQKHILHILVYLLGYFGEKLIHRSEVNQTNSPFVDVLTNYKYNFNVFCCCCNFTPLVLYEINTPLSPDLSHQC